MQGKEVKIVDGKKMCSQCQLNLPVEDFSKNLYIKCGLNTRCRKCYSKNRIKPNEKAKIRIRKNALMRNFNITIEQYDILLSKQKGKCAICEKSENLTKNGTYVLFAIDHCHKTGKIRGLLCTKCNLLLGQANDNVEILKEALII